LIDYITGKLIEKGPGWIVVENNGKGFHVEVPLSRDIEKWEEGQEIKVFTRLTLREDGLNLYGFAGAEERNLFNLITGVSGFGPRLALSVLGLTSASQFYIAVLEEDVKTLCNIPGVGRKSAQRLILELKEKLPKFFPSFPGEEVTKGDSTTEHFGTSADEALNALQGLGYTYAEAISVLDKIPAEEKNTSTENIIKIALKKMSTR